MSTEETPKPSSPSNWKLPDGIEDVLESGIIKATVGAATGAVLGTLLFKSGKGWRSAGAAMGVGVAVGSTVERAMCSKAASN
jgi:hypothetical protein